MKVVFARIAEQNLEEIGDYIARDNPARAVSFIEELRIVALALGQMPRAYPLVLRFEQVGIRRRIHGNYLIFYRVEHDRVLIVLIAHRARDYDKLLIPER